MTRSSETETNAHASLRARYPDPPEGIDRGVALAYMHTRAAPDTVSRDWTSFNLDGEEEKRRGGHLTLADWLRSMEH